MSLIKAKVNIETSRKSYGPGEVITEKLCDTDMDFLRKHGFISVEDAGQESGEMLDGMDAGYGEGEDPEDGSEADVYKDLDALKKMTKDEIVSYAARLDLELDAASLKNDLIDAVQNRMEELMAERQ